MSWRWLAALVGCLPWTRMAMLGHGLGWFVGRVLRIRRRHVVGALMRARVVQPDQVANRMYAGLGTSVFELLWTASRASRSSGSRPPDVQVEGWELVEKAMAMGRGVVVATGHTGNWDRVGCAVAARVPLSVVTKHLSWRSLDRFWQDLRARQGIHLLDAAGALTHARQRLKEGGAVTFLIDQAPMRQRGVECAPFLNAVAEHDATFAIVAARYRAPVVLAFALRRSDGTHVLSVRDVLLPPARPCRAWIRKTTLRAASELEDVVRTHPEQWLWLHRRWKRVLEDDGSPQSTSLTTQSSRA